MYIRAWASALLLVSTTMGNAKASKRGTSNRDKTPALFLYMYINETLTLQSWEFCWEESKHKHMEGLEKTVENGIVTYEIKDFTFADGMEWQPTTLWDVFPSIIKDVNRLIIPPSIRHIKCNFWNCKDLKEFVVCPGNLYFSTDENGALYSFDKDILYKVPPATEGAFIVPESVKNIGNHAFGACERLNEIKIGENVRSIGINAFYDCNTKIPIVIPDDIRYFEGCTFHQTSNMSHLSSVFIYRGKQYSYIELSKLLENQTIG